MSGVTYEHARYTHEGEQLFLGHLIYEPEKLRGAVPAELKAGHFYQGPHARIFEAVQAVYAAGRLPTKDLVKEQLKATDRLAEAGAVVDEVWSKALRAAVASPKILAGHAALIIEMATRRKLLEVTPLIGALAGELDAGRGDGAIKTITKMKALLERVPVAAATAASGARPLAWLSASDLTATVEEPKYLVEKVALAPGTLCILAGQAFSGKSVVAHELALCIAGNRSSLGGHGMITTPGPVALLDYEMGRALTVRRIQRLCKGRGLDLASLVEERRVRVACFPDVKLTDADAIDRMRGALEGVAFAVIDSARAMMPGVDENDSAVRTYLDQLGELADTTGTAILLLHHAGKLTNEQKSDPRAYFRGSSGFLDAVSTAYVLTTDADEPQACVFRHIKCRHRGVPAKPFKLVIEDKVSSVKPNSNDPADRAALRLLYQDWLEVKEADSTSARGRSTSTPPPAPRNPFTG